MSNEDALDLIPESVAQFIARSNAWSDGDTWVIGNGRVVAYDIEQHRFYIHDRKSKTVLGSASFKAVIFKGST